MKFVEAVTLAASTNQCVRREGWEDGYRPFEGSLFAEKNVEHRHVTDADTKLMVAVMGPAIIGAALMPNDLQAEDWLVYEPKPDSYWLERRSPVTKELYAKGYNISTVLASLNEDEDDLPFDPDADDAEASAAEFMAALDDEGEDVEEPSARFARLYGDLPSW